MIKDSDFDKLLEMPKVDNQMLTDFHDRELFLSELDVDAILGNKYGIAIDVKSIAMAIRGLSVTKWFNMVNDCKLAFRRKCVVSKVYDGQSDVSVDDCITQLADEKKNEGKQIPDKTQVACFMESAEGADWRQYTNGHDWLKATEVCPREGVHGIQVPLGAWHSVIVHEPSTILEAKDGANKSNK